MHTKYLLICLLSTLPLVAHHYQRETARTYWIAWTTEHTRTWEIYEQQDTAVSYFRRNEFFEDIDALIQRDTHWITLYNKAYERINATPAIPALGFAVCDKQSGELLGTVQLLSSHCRGYLSLSYGLTSSARNARFGSEIIQELMMLIEELRGSPTLCFDTPSSEQSFWTTWHHEGKKKTPDFDNLLSYFAPQQTSLRSIIASVDVYNPASLAILLKNNMQPIEIECTQYYFSADSSLRFDVDIKLIYPASEDTVHPILLQLTRDIISRNNNAIESAHKTLKHLFGIESEWIYLQLTRAEKAALRLHHYTVTTAYFSEYISTIKQSYFGGQCRFIR